MASSETQGSYFNGVRRYRVVVLGDGGVGKSALVLQYVQRSFIEHHDPTIEDAYQRRTAVDGEACLLDILDTAGQVEFGAMREQYMRGGEGFVVCYSIADKRSFAEAEEYRNLILKVRANEDVPAVLVACKADLEEARVVSEAEGQALAAKLGCKFVETSSAQRRGVDEAFTELVRDVRKRQREGVKAESDGSSSRWRRFWSSVYQKTRARASAKRNRAA